MSLIGASRAQKRAAAKAINGQTQTKWNSYYSRVRIPASTANTTGAITVLKGAHSRGFSYGIGQDMSPAINGVTGTTATQADTNILTANQTVSAESVLIEGIGLIMSSNSEPVLALALDPVCSVVMILNGTTRYPLGIPSLLPGPGGLFGAGVSYFAVPGGEYGFATGVGCINNGMPLAQNYFHLPEPTAWMSTGSNVDTNLNVQFTVESAITTSAVLGGAGNRAGSTADTAGAPYYLQAFTAATTGAVFVDYLVVLVGRTFQPLSNN
jgi:hypothetical protein